MRETSARCGPMRLLASTTMTVAASLFGPPSTARLGRDVEIRQAAGGHVKPALSLSLVPALTLTLTLRQTGRQRNAQPEPRAISPDPNLTKRQAAEAVVRSPHGPCLPVSISGGTRAAS